MLIASSAAAAAAAQQQSQQLLTSVSKRASGVMTFEATEKCFQLLQQQQHATLQTHQQQQQQQSRNAAYLSNMLQLGAAAAVPATAVYAPSTVAGYPQLVANTTTAGERFCAPISRIVCSRHF